MASTLDKELQVPSESEKDATVAASLSPRDSSDDVSQTGKNEKEGIVEPSVEAEGEYVTGWKLVSLVSGMTTACFLMLLDMSILVTAIPRITTEFHSLKDIGWYGSAYNLASASLQPLSGKIYTYFKIKWAFLMFLSIFMIGSLICAVAKSSITFIVGRAIAGIGTSGIQNGSFAILAAAAPLERRPPLLGIIMGVCQLGLVSGPLIGGALTEYTTWRWCFYINLPIGAVTGLLILLVQIPEKQEKPKTGLFKIILEKFDLPGFFIFAPFAIMILLALEWGGNIYAWKSATVIGLFCGGGGALIAFLLWEAYVGDDAMIPLSVVKQREIWTSCLSMLLLFAAVMGTSYYLPIYFQSIRGASPLTSGVNMLPGILTQLTIAVASGFLLQKLGYYLPMAAFSAAVAAIGSGLLSTLSPTTSTAKWAGFQAIGGIGRGFGMQSGIIAIQANTTPKTSATGTALMVFCQTFGGAIFLSIANSIFDNKVESELSSQISEEEARRIIAAGASAVQQVTPAKDLPVVLASYAKGVDAVFYLLTAATCLMFFTTFGMGWKDIRKKKVVPAATTEA